MGQSPDKPSLAPVADIYALLERSRSVRALGRPHRDRTHRPRGVEGSRPRRDQPARRARRHARLGPDGQRREPAAGARRSSSACSRQTSLSAENKLRLYRTFMYTATEVKDGLPAAQREQLNGRDHRPVPRAPDERLNRELALMLGYAGQPAAIAKILAAIPKTSTNQELQLHYLYALRMIKQGWTAEQTRRSSPRCSAAPRSGAAARSSSTSSASSSTRSPSSTRRTTRSAALREGAGLLAAHADRARRDPGAPGGGSGRWARWPWWRWRARRRPGGTARGTNRWSGNQPAGDVRGNGVSAAAGARRRGRPEGVRGQLRVVPQVRLGRHRPRGRRA